MVNFELYHAKQIETFLDFNSILKYTIDIFYLNTII